MQTPASATSSLDPRDCHAIASFAATLPDPELEFTRDEAGAVLAMFRFGGTEICVWREAGAIVIHDLAAPGHGAGLVSGAATARHALASLLARTEVPARTH